MIIVAKYKEDVSWCKDLDCIIYDKSKKKGKNVLENIGRESHTYLTYIIENYDSLPEYMIFTQAHPFDHVPDFLSKLDIRKSYYDFGVTTEKSKLEQDRISRFGVTIFEGADLELFKKMTDILKLKLTTFDVSFYGIFGVSKTVVERYTLEQYKSLLELHKEPIAPYLMEYLWRAMYA